MRLFIIAIAATMFISGCKDEGEKKVVHLPSKDYRYIESVPATFANKSRVYVPIYSHIYMLNGSREINLTATLSIRHTTFSDSIIITKVDYYSSQGKLLKQYISKPLLLQPMNSVEFVVEEKESEGGAGANFIVEYSSAAAVADPLVQAVMISSYNTMGISFTTNGIKEQ